MMARNDLLIKNDSFSKKFFKYSILTIVSIALSLRRSEPYTVSNLLDDLKKLTGQNDERSSRSDDTDGLNAVDDAQKKSSSYEAGTLVPKPVLVPVPGPPGPQGPPGLPGAPGLPGKSPSLKGLKAVLLARLAKVLLLIKALAVLCFGLNAAVLATTLGLTLPLYKKFKKAGVVVPATEDQSALPTYGQAAGSPYGSPVPPIPYQPRPDSGSFAPYPSEHVDSVQTNVFDGIKKMFAKFGA